MDITFKKSDWAIATDPAAERADSMEPEWHGLRARFVAAHAARKAINDGCDSQEAFAAGSFHKPSASRLAVFEKAYSVVNQNDLGNRNCDGSILDSVADMCSTGGRGLK